jgi:glucose/arabinose dehydrogenase
MGRLHRFTVVLRVVVLAAGADSAAAVDPAKLKLLKLPPGFEIAVYADGVKEARSLALGAAGTVFVGSREAGNVYALVDRDGDHRADQQYTLARGLRMPNGVAFRDGALYVAEIHRVLRYDGIEARLADPPAPVVVNDTFPRDRWHGWKFIPVQRLPAR